MTDRNMAARVGSWWKSFRAVSLRPHLSTILFLIPVLALLVLANVPGWRVAYLDLDWEDSPFSPKPQSTRATSTAGR